MLFPVFLLLVIAGFSKTALAGFPNDFSDVNWIDPDISSWPVTAGLEVTVAGSDLIVNHTKKNTWPARAITSTSGVCCNTSVWVFANRGGQWYASTFEYLRPGQTVKKSNTVSGTYIKRPPFLESGFNWRPANGELLGFMVSGLARFTLGNVNVRERSNVFCLRWNVGPVDCGAAPPPKGFDFAGTISGQSSPNKSLIDFSRAFKATLFKNRDLEIVIKGQTLELTINKAATFRRRVNLVVPGGCSVNGVIEGLAYKNDDGGSTLKGELEGTATCGNKTPAFRATFEANSDSLAEFKDGIPLPDAPKPPLGSVIQLLMNEDL